MTLGQDNQRRLSSTERHGEPRTRSYVQLLALTAFCVVACNRAEGYVKPSVPVRVSTVREAPTADQELRLSGTAAAEAEIALSFKVGGYVTSILTVRDADGRTRLVQAGDKIHRGTTLARVRQEDYRQSEAEARGALEAAAAADQALLDHERTERLLGSGTIPQAEYDAVRARTDEALGAVDAAAARLANTRIALGDSTLRAPVDALVLARSVEIGNLVCMGERLPLPLASRRVGTRRRPGRVASAHTFKIFAGKASLRCGTADGMRLR